MKLSKIENNDPRFKVAKLVPTDSVKNPPQLDLVKEVLEIKILLKKILKQLEKNT